MRGLEAQGVPSKQAEAITAALTEVLNDSLENVAHSFVSKAEMQRVIANICVIYLRFFCFARQVFDVLFVCLRKEHIRLDRIGLHCFVLCMTLR